MDKSGPEKRIGILGGTFNPIHFGHLAIAAAAKKQAELDRVIFIPARLPPHKNPENLIDPKLRYAMTALAISNEKDYAISGIEIEKKTVSYSIETLKQLRKIYPQAELFFIIGSDSVPELKTWRLINEIYKLCCFIVARRPDFSAFNASELPERALILNGIYPDISSRQIRQLLKQGLNVDELVPEPVISYIKQNRLYL